MCSSDLTSQINQGGNAPKQGCSSTCLQNQHEGYDPRELIPLGPNGQQPGQGQQPQPGQGQTPADCPVQIYQDGQLFTFPRPGQQPGQGQGNQPGQSGGAQELIPLNPSTPSSPSTPNTPSSPSTPSSPTNPRS